MKKYKRIKKIFSVYCTVKLITFCSKENKGFRSFDQIHLSGNRSLSIKTDFKYNILNIKYPR